MFSPLVNTLSNCYAFTSAQQSQLTLYPDEGERHDPNMLPNLASLALFSTQGAVPPVNPRRPLTFHAAVAHPSTPTAQQRWQGGLNGPRQIGTAQVAAARQQPAVEELQGMESKSPSHLYLWLWH